eukprot:scaffold79518_cov19-Tisochrysis_lutea.AAC.1
MAQSNIHHFSKKRQRDDAKEQSLEQYRNNKAHKAQVHHEGKNSTLLSLLSSNTAGCAPKPAKHCTAKAGTSLTSFLRKQEQQQQHDPAPNTGSRGRQAGVLLEHDSCLSHLLSQSELAWLCALCTSTIVLMIPGPPPPPSGRTNFSPCPHQGKKLDRRTLAPKGAASSSSSRGLLVLGRSTHEEAAAAAAGHAAGSRRNPRARQLFNFYEDGAGQWVRSKQAVLGGGPPNAKCSDDETIGIEGADAELKWEGIGTTML